jgi:ubiquinone/menaquinone biosynthesis C-methylase UbiE
MTDNDWLMALLLDVHRGLPRQGPGDDASTLRALEMCSQLPMRPDVLDVGCGPGMQTVALAQATGGTVTAVDLFEQFLDQLRERALAAGVRERIQVMRADMRDLPFGKDSFDLLWSEGAAYIMGITAAFEGWKPFLRPQGYLVVSEIVWRVADGDVPQDLYDYFHGEYPGITDVRGNLRRIRECGYEVVGHFTLPDESWWTHYYDPLSANLQAMREKYRLDPRALRFIDESEDEQRLRREYADAYGYEFFVTRLIDPDAPRRP